MSHMGAFPIDACRDVPGVQLFAHATEGELRSPFAAENALAAGLNRRGNHFLAGRLAAHAALAAAGAPSGAIPRGRAGEPVWPAGYIGSISHTHGIAIAAVCATSVHASLGIDVEKRDRTVAEGVQRHVCHPDERDWVNAPSGLPVQNTMALISAKEVIFKAYFQVTGIRLGYQDARLCPSEGGFAAEVLYPFTTPAGLAQRMWVRWFFFRDFWLTFGTLPLLVAGAYK